MSDDKTTLSLAEFAARMGKTEDEMKAWMEDRPNRWARTLEKLSKLPGHQELLRRHAPKRREP